MINEDSRGICSRGSFALQSYNRLFDNHDKLACFYLADSAGDGSTDFGGIVRICQLNLYNVLGRALVNHVDLTPHAVQLELYNPGAVFVQVAQTDGLDNQGLAVFDVEPGLHHNPQAAAARRDGR